MLEFADPWLFVLLGLPVLVYFLAPGGSPGGSALIVPEGVSRHILGGAAHGSAAIWDMRRVAPLLIWALLVTALAGPRVLAPQQALPMSGRDLILALDLSGSMVREDFALDGKQVTRLDAVKAVGAGFVKARAGDRVGLVVFGSEAYVAAAPTFDTDSVAQIISELVIGISGRATNISDGVGISLKRLENSDAQTGVIILLSDGANNAGAATPRDVAGLASRMGVRIHTIALGPVALGETEEKRGAVDAQTLQAMADIGGGEMFRVRTTEDLREAARTLDGLEPTARSGLSAQAYDELWLWPALLAGLLGLGLGLRSWA
ncbi:VWA domain-containing protein [Hoeflea ulvae]|uniref:VWA domain-containing protein n=1 Tax=Hoeflea ulvae TaxID=2983764 RepID=A0ABT3YL44_9HYPH|nr:VWA domain-containing protein [Hoeflea ulvae]MCY0096494.1 VWA domain-containing protein [Hoeflea ulvae]